MRSRWWCWLVLSLWGCRAKAPAPETVTATSAPLLAEARAALAERDRRLSGYHLEVRTVEAGQEARHEVFVRDGRLKGVLTAPQAFTQAFDGTRLFKRFEAERRFETWELKLPREKASGFLTQAFLPFVPEGYRAPLLPSQGVSAALVQRSGVERAVALSTTVRDEAGAPLTVIYTYRLPQAELLEKRTVSAGGESVLTVTASRCDDALRLCVPGVLELREQGALVTTTTVATAELNPPLPAESFTLAAPEGWSLVHHEVVERGVP
jgi:hypothetical protein